MDSLGKIGEHEAIKRLTSVLGSHPDLRTGTGDDCAVTILPGSEFDQVFTTDPIIEQIHFRPHEKPERIGNKAAGRVLSDLAAMGAQPQWILVNVVAAPEQDVAVLEKIYAGMTALCQRFGATIIGGDLARGSCLELHVFGVGVLPAGRALLRSGARPNDAIFISGPLGCSIEGKHLDFVPRVKEGIFLRETGMVTSMMDISDGLATDLRHILKQSGVGALLSVDQIPRAGTLEQALYDGEDFELLFTAPEELAEGLCAQWQEHFGSSLSVVGTITGATGQIELRANDGSITELEGKAFEHFRSFES